jgi:hypothetical protein
MDIIERITEHLNNLGISGNNGAMLNEEIAESIHKIYEDEGHGRGLSDKKILLTHDDLVAEKKRLLKEIQERIELQTPFNCTDHECVYGENMNKVCIYWQRDACDYKWFQNLIERETR